MELPKEVYREDIVSESGRTEVRATFIQECVCQECGFDRMYFRLETHYGGTTLKEIECLHCSTIETPYVGVNGELFGLE